MIALAQPSGSEARDRLYRRIGYMDANATYSRIDQRVVRHFKCGLHGPSRLCLAGAGNNRGVRFIYHITCKCLNRWIVLEPGDFKIP